MHPNLWLSHWQKQSGMLCQLPRIILINYVILPWWMSGFLQTPLLCAMQACTACVRL